MPVQYANVIEEHRLTRSAAGLFDICHMVKSKSAANAPSISSRRH